eukprot:jgi/Bigna1/67723/fgenesh1_pg.4_\
MSNPHCVVALQPTTQVSRMTKTQSATVNCVWNETFVFEDIFLSKEEFAAEKIGLNIYSRNFFVVNTLVGCCEFSLQNVYRQTNHEYYRKWVPIVHPDYPEVDTGLLR